MENQEETNKAPTTRQMIHLQVAGDFSQEDLVALITKFQETATEGGVIATPNHVLASVINVTQDLSGMILTPKLTALELAAVVVDVNNGYELSQGNPVTPRFEELEQDVKIEILTRIQFVLRFGALPKAGYDLPNDPRDAVFEATVRSLGTKLIQPVTENLITVTRVAQKEGDEDFDVSFKDLVQGDIFKHGDGKFVAESNPYVNWIASPIPVITIDAKVYEAPEKPAEDEVKSCEPSKKKVQSKPSKSTAKSRKK